MSEGLRKIGCLIAFFPVLCFLHFFAGFLSPADPDLGYHLAIGNGILESGQFPEQDLFRIDSDAPEIAYSWLPDVSLALAYRWGGVLGLRLWVATSIFLLSFPLVALLFGRLPNLASAGILIVSSFCLLPVCTPRPTVWAFLFYGLLLLFLRGVEEKNVRNGNVKEAIVLLVLIVLWGNSHISVVFAPLVILVVGSGSWLFGNEHFSLSKTFGYAFISLFAMMLNPYSFELIPLAFEFSPIGQSSVSSKIYELRGFFEMLEPRPLWADAGIILALLWVVVTVSRFFAFSRAKVFSKSDSPKVDRTARKKEFGGLFGAILLVMLFAVASVISSRYFSFFVVSVLFSLGCRRSRSYSIDGLAVLIGLFVFVLSAGLGMSKGAWANQWYDPTLALGRFPVRAIDQLEPLLHSSRPKGGRWRLLVPFGDGHFATWWLKEHRLSGNAGVFLDGRTDALGKERFSIAEEMFEGKCYEAQLREYDVDIVIAERKDALFEILDADNSWIAVSGDNAVAFVRDVYLGDYSPAVPPPL